MFDFFFFIFSFSLAFPLSEVSSHVQFDLKATVRLLLRDTSAGQMCVAILGFNMYMPSLNSLHHFAAPGKTLKLKIVIFGSTSLTYEAEK